MAELLKRVPVWMIGVAFVALTILIIERTYYSHSSVLIFGEEFGVSSADPERLRLEADKYDERWKTKAKSIEERLAQVEKALETLSAESKPETGDRGPKGDIGPRGPAGPAGVSPSNAQIAALIRSEVERLITPKQLEQLSDRETRLRRYSPLMIKENKLVSLDDIGLNVGVSAVGKRNEQTFCSFSISSSGKEEEFSKVVGGRVELKNVGFPNKWLTVDGITYAHGDSGCTFVVQ